MDPLTDHPNQVDKSPYSAFWNNPIKYNDPDGRCPICSYIIIGFLMLESQPASTPGSHKDHVTIKQAQDEFNISQLFPLIPGGKAAKPSQIVAGRVSNEIKNEVKEEVVKRVTPRKSTKEQVTQNQPRDAEGRMIDPNTKEPLKTGEIDLGHKPGYEWKTRAQMHKDKGSTRQEVIETENNPSLYQWEDRSANRSHKYELKEGSSKTSKDN